MFTFKVDGADSIDKDFEEFNRDVAIASNYGLRTVASELTPALQRHIRKDVYEAYTPRRYQRRYDHPEYGRSLFDIGNMNWSITRNGGMESVEFSYEPDGRNTHYPSKDYYEEGNSIIRALQEDIGYLWRSRGSIGRKRPFWDNFVDEVGKKADGWFVQGFNEYDDTRNVRVVKDSNVILEESDYDLPQSGGISQIQPTKKTESD